MQCPRCAAEGVDAAGYCVNCRLYRGPVMPPPGFAPPPAPRNPLLIPGIIFGVVCALVVAAVIVYAATADSGGTPAAQASAAASPTATADRPSPTAAEVPASAEPSASGSAQPSSSAAPLCLLGVWLETQHDEQVQVVNVGEFTFSGAGAYQRYSDSGRVVVDYGDGLHLKVNGTNKYEYILAGVISYQYKIDGGLVTYSSPSPSADGTETFVVNGRVAQSGKLQARAPRPMRPNCGPVAMTLANDTLHIDLKRTSPTP
ncbi:hypothetical protein AB0M46_35770 [Dactylosporangium sp. NPDC051485]|uniref:hypothetical protein n=1 Tax=Dactylosporangium sp. NPDC051485 TaxID=3154846 RepID=UPI00343A84F5